jgi:hypothetical protein
MPQKRRRTPAEVAGIDRDLLARLRPLTEEQRLSEPRVVFPTLDVEGYSGWLCKVCLRSAEPDLQPWSWFGCEHCRAVDGRVAGAFGAKRYLPLGQHSMMNGLFLRPDGVSDAKVTAFYDQLTAMNRGWASLHAWRTERAAELTWMLQAILGEDLNEIPLSVWTEMMDPGPQASAREYRGLLRDRHPWMLDLDERFDDVDWLAGKPGQEG